MESLVLDVGCGKHKRGDVGIDYVRSPSVDVVADAEHLPFISAVFDRVVSYCVLEHSPNPLNFLREQFRVVKPDGNLELITDNACFFRWNVLKWRSENHETMHEDHHVIFFPLNVQKLLKGAGFSDIKIKLRDNDEGKIGKFAKMLVLLNLLRPECMYRRIQASASA